MKISPVIMCGGVGSRLWPLSTLAKPKQFLKFFNSNESLLQRTVRRFLGREHFSSPIFLTNAIYIDILEEQLKEIGVSDYSIIAEPFAKNTAPALTIAAMFVKNYRDNDLIIAVPADSYINNNDIFIDAVYTAKNHIENNDNFILFGIEPAYPEEGFGYMKPKFDSSNTVIKKIEYFFEKPTKEKAVEYMKSGCLWNSGMVMFNPALFLQELAQQNKNLVNLCQASYEISSLKGNTFWINPKHFEDVENISIDYALLEVSSMSNVIPIVGIHWNDVGSWKAVYDLSQKDKDNNVIIGNVKAINCTNCYIYSPESLTAVVGLENKIIINIKDICLNIDMNETQNIKQLSN
jgi:mannose-1-phosphate guanylyltransferase/mannose-6-phosphate isomerase